MLVLIMMTTLVFVVDLVVVFVLIVDASFGQRRTATRHLQVLAVESDCCPRYRLVVRRHVIVVFVIARTSVSAQRSDKKGEQLGSILNYQRIVVWCILRANLRFVCEACDCQLAGKRKLRRKSDAVQCLLKWWLRFRGVCWCGRCASRVVGRQQQLESIAGSQADVAARHHLAQPPAAHVHVVDVEHVHHIVAVEGQLVVALRLVVIQRNG